MTTAAPPIQHVWVKWSLTSVDVIVDPFTGGCSVVESPGQDVGEQICCHTCGEPLTESSVLESCEGGIEQ
jgi:hypothetical protein